jgi:hypothetical protein
MNLKTASFIGKNYILWGNSCGLWSFGKGRERGVLKPLV